MLVSLTISYHSPSVNTFWLAETKEHATCLNKAHTHCALPNGSLPTVLVLTLITAILLYLSQLLLRFLAIILTAAASNYWVLIPAFVVMAVFLFFRWYYLKTSREIKRLEAIGRFHISGLRKEVVWHDRLFMCGKLVFGQFLTIFSLAPTLSPPSSSQSSLLSHIHHFTRAAYH